jgi:hypothetical protein
MSSACSSTVAAHAHQPTSRGSATITAVALTVALHFSPAAADAQATRSAPVNGWEFLMSSGVLVPTGAQRDALKDARLSTAQLSYVVRSRFAMTTMVGWARSRDLASANDPKLDVFTYDLGAEARAPEWFAGRSVTFTPFVGAGGGARSYNHRKLEVDATHNVAGYAAVGGEFAMGRVGLRVEARDYVSGFRPLVGGGRAHVRNDVVALLGLSLRTSDK